jgi:hypothetical protein
MANRRAVIGDTPEHAKHLISDGATVTECSGGLSFALGVACMEAELRKDATILYRVQHPNELDLYHVAYMPSGDVIVRRVG